MDLSPKCTRSKARVPLTSRGLIGGAAGPFFSDEYGCQTPRRVLIRVRAVFVERLTLRFGTVFPGAPRVWYALGHVKQGSIAVRTLKGKPIAFAAVKNTGKARIFTRGSCG